MREPRNRCVLISPPHLSQHENLHGTSLVGVCKQKSAAGDFLMQGTEMCGRQAVGRRRRWFRGRNVLNEFQQLCLVARNSSGGFLNLFLCRLLGGILSHAEINSLLQLDQSGRC